MPMLEKMGYDTICETCGKACVAEEMRENDMCDTCGEKWDREQTEYLRPSWKAERRRRVIHEYDEEGLAMRRQRTSRGLSYSEIAQKFNVSTMTAYRAVVGQSWR